MKKFLNCLILLFVYISFTGCNAKQKVSSIMFDSLKTEKMINQDFEFVEQVILKNISYNISSKTYYIYKDAKDNFIAVTYASTNGDYSVDADYKVSIYKASLTNDKIIYIDKEQLDGKEQYFIYDNKYAENNKYDLTLIAKYAALEKKSLFAKKHYTFTLIED